jgi:hypothetical protein
MFANREHEAVFEFYDPEIEWIASASPFPQSAGGVDDLNVLIRANMEDQIERFAAALQADHILPEDF